MLKYQSIKAFGVIICALLYSTFYPIMWQPVETHCSSIVVGLFSIQFQTKIENSLEPNKKTTHRLCFHWTAWPSGCRCTLQWISQQNRWAWISNLIPRFSGDTKQKRTLNQMCFSLYLSLSLNLAIESNGIHMRIQTKISLMICFSGSFFARALKSFVRISIDKKSGDFWCSMFDDGDSKKKMMKIDCSLYWQMFAKAIKKTQKKKIWDKREHRSSHIEGVGQRESARRLI